MVITVDVKAALLCLLFAALIVLVIFLIVAVGHLVTTLKQTNKLLQDASVVSGVAAEKAVQLDGVITDVQSTVSDLSKAVKGQQNLAGSISSLVKALGSLASIANNKKKGEGKESAKKQKNHS